MHTLTNGAHVLGHTLWPQGPRAEAIIANTARILSLLVAAAVAVAALHLQAPDAVLTL